MASLEGGGDESERVPRVRSRNAPSSSPAPAIRLVNFVSEEQLDVARKTRGERVEDGTAQRDKPLYEILKENKDKKDAEFNERFKHRPPKALDEDETEFLDKLAESRREYEQHLANEEAEQLRSFQYAVAAQSSIVRELKEAPTFPRPEENKPSAKRSQPVPLKNMIIAVKPQAKKAKTAAADKRAQQELPSNGHVNNKPPADTNAALGSLVSYSGESDSD